MEYKILLIGSSYKVGLTFHFTRLAIALRRMGNKVAILSTGKVQYDHLLEELGSFGIKRYVIDVLDDLDAVSTIKAAKLIRSILKNESGFDIILGDGVRNSLKIWLSTRKLDEKTTTFAILGSLPKTKIGLYAASFSYRMFYDRCIALCDYTRKKLESLGVKPKRIYVIPLFAPDLEWFDHVKKSEINLDIYGLQDVKHPVVFYAASHYSHKGFEYYLKAASEVLKKFEATFILGGRGPLTPSLKKLADKLGISKNVIFTGWISNYHMPYMLNKIADICVSTSLVEQLPSYLMECMAAGKPVVASSVGGVPEIVIDGINGYLVPSRDYKETASRIMELLNEPKKARGMGQTGRRIIEQQFNMEASVKKLINIYGALHEDK